MGENWWPWS